MPLQYDPRVINRLDPCKILFIGSSYFNFNDLPNIFENLGISSRKEIYVDNHGRNGLYLDDHASSSETELKINEKDWDYVILQGVGTNTAYPDHFNAHPLYPALVTLKNKIHQNCNTTKIIFCMPWAFEDGMTWYQDWSDTYEDMQLKIFENTINYSKEIGFSIAPVGWAWYYVLDELDYPLHYLHMSDWNHPSIKGSYLMACVIYSTIFIENITDNPYYGGLDEDEAIYFQNIASHTVLDNLNLWNIENASNNPPYAPLIEGIVNGKAGDSLNYTIVTTDPDGDEVSYFVDWGDNFTGGWTRLLPSGEYYNVSHNWEEQDTYTIKVKAKDVKGAESDWTTLEVTMPKLKQSFIDNEINVDILLIGLVSDVQINELGCSIFFMVESKSILIITFTNNSFHDSTFLKNGETFQNNFPLDASIKGFIGDNLIFTKISY
jgi:hypothetical protein